MGGTCVLASCMDEILCSLRAQMSAAKTEQDRGCDGSTQASLLLSDKKRKHLLAVATHVSTSVFISLKRCSLKKISKSLRMNRDQHSCFTSISKCSSQTLHTQTETLTHLDLSSGPNSTESFPHYVGILNPQEEAEGQEGISTDNKREAERQRDDAQGAHAGEMHTCVQCGTNGTIKEIPLMNKSMKGRSGCHL